MKSGMKITYKSNLKKIFGQLEKAATEARTETAEIIGDEAQANAPVKSGALRDSKEVEHGSEKSLVGFTAPHAAAAEFGTSKTAGRGFLTAAMAKNEETLKRKLAQKAKEASE